MVRDFRCGMVYPMYLKMQKLIQKNYQGFGLEWVSTDWQCSKYGINDLRAFLKQTLDELSHLA